MADNFDRLKPHMTEEQMLKKLDAGFEQSNPAMREHYKTVRDLKAEYKELTKEAGTFGDIFSGNYAKRLAITKKLKTSNSQNNKLTKEDVKDANKAGAAAKARYDQVRKTFPIIDKTRNAYSDMKSILGKFGISGALLGIGAAVAMAAKAAFEFYKETVKIRKSLGTSLTTSAKILAQQKALTKAGKLYGLEQQDIADAQMAVRKDITASAVASSKLVMNIARTAAATGQTAGELTKTLKVMQSVSTASKEVLLNQMRTNAAMMEAAGVAPGQVMKDIAQNTEFFAKYAKDGGQNMVMAGIAARKLGLDMSALQNTASSLLDFETSIEKSMEASMLLGRSINLDRARQLALTGDHSGMLKEVLKQVGGEAEFNRLNVIQRKALADSVGQSVENLSRLVRNNTATTTGATVAQTSGDQTVDAIHGQTAELSKQSGYLKDIRDAVE